MPEAILALLGDLHSPTCLAWHHGKGIIPTSSPSRLSFVVSIYGVTGSSENGPGKKLVLGVIDNLSGAQPGLTLTPIIKRRDSAKGTFGNPVAMDVNHVTGEIFFADVITGELSVANPLE